MTAGTKANHFWTLAMVLDNAKAPKRSVEMYKNTSRNLSDLEQFKRGQQVMSADRARRYVFYDEMARLRAFWKRRFDADRSDIVTNYSHLLLAVMTLQPPIRAEIADMTLWTRRGFPPQSKKPATEAVAAPAATTQNYLFRRAKRDPWAYWINSDKMTEREKRRRGDQYITPHIPLDSDLARRISASTGTDDDATLSSIVDDRLQPPESTSSR